MTHRPSLKAITMPHVLFLRPTQNQMNNQYSSKRNEAVPFTLAHHARLCQKKSLIMLNPPIDLHKSLLFLLVRIFIEAERATEQVIAQLVPLTQEVWGQFYCQASRENQALLTTAFPAHNSSFLLRTVGLELSLATLDFLCQVRTQYNRMVQCMQRQQMPIPWWRGRFHISWSQCPTLGHFLMYPFFNQKRYAMEKCIYYLEWHSEVMKIELSQCNPLN